MSTDTFSPAPPIQARVVLCLLLAVAGLSFIAGLFLSHALVLDANWPTYADMVGNLNQPGAWLRWGMGDISEFAFYKHEFAGIGLLAGAGLAWWANSTGKRWQGFAISYGSGLWPWLVTSSLLSLLLSNLLWGWTLDADTWQPTFVAFVSLPAALVLLYGPGWKVALNGAVFGALLVTPASLLLVNYVCVPLKIPAVVGAVSGMALASAVVFLACKWFPALMTSCHPPIAPQPPVPPSHYGLIWGMRRVLADFSEAPFFGNELASLGLLAGVLLAWALNPDSPVYGTGLLLPIIAGQLLTSAIGIYLWRGHWMTKGWYPTYIPMVCVVPAAILTHGGSALVVALSAVLGALLAPPLADGLAQKLPAWMHPFVANVVAMAISTVLIVPFIGLLIVASACTQGFL
ncbi:hypothetical protein PMM47T1_03479 [Pseudomonas sp. M47T1]|uniref:hypothetical protein n=1 Tax=Pseudomonas sp. M47T1 TaxID=1179778 RepID=UPI0002606E8D|nr:hypothetical protein [Pseudomonas sp. M47T1]EIK98293.1 hypothetical protein PMM47T1_03479 [Pseudomonas sp. M47T1]